MSSELQKIIDNAPKEVKDHFIHKDAKEGELIVCPIEKNRRLYFLLSGEADVYKERENGTLASYNTYASGQIFGELELFNEDVSTASISARTPCRLLILDKEYVYYWMQRDFAFTELVCKKFASDIKALTDNLFGLKPLPLRYRFLSVVCAREQRGSLQKLSKHDLCRYLGTDIRCVNRIVKEYSEKGILSYGEKRFAVADSEGLYREMSRWKKQLQL